MQSDIMNKWGSNNGNSWTYTDKSSGKVFDVQFDVQVSLYNGKEKADPLIIAESWDPSNMDNFIDVGASLDEVGRSFVSGGDEGSWRGVGRNSNTLAQDDPAPHEFGHLVGLTDRYDDKNGVHSGWENNIMGNSQTGSVDQRNIDAVVGDGVSSFNAVQTQISNINQSGKGKLSNDAVHFLGTGTFKYNIDIARPNK
jgi:hypothetical protein